MAEKTKSIREEFLISRRKYIENQFSNLNEVQRQATLTVDGPMLIIAGAGSGKTTVLVNRILNLVEFGTAYISSTIFGKVTQDDLDELNTCIAENSKANSSLQRLLHDNSLQAYNILAITFTNKAANELKERIIERVGERGKDVFASTFHSACVRFLRRDADKIGYTKNFTIYDADDSKRIIKTILKDFGVDDRIVTPAEIVFQISRVKDRMCSCEEYMVSALGPKEELYARVYREYQRRLKLAGAMDFDDLIFNTVVLLSENAELQEYYHNRFKYIFVDEYQDTSIAQFLLIKLLLGAHRNLCVVGDDDQSIYKFRGATIENILSFEESFPGAKVVRLEQNYRSTAQILDAANHVIEHNMSRKGKTLWTNNETGAAVSVFRAKDEEEEISYIISKIVEAHKNGESYGSNAILYRMNTQAKQYENTLRLMGIPYKIFGSIRFLDRAEVKDILSYMSIVNNPEDELRLNRIINLPARKIGRTTTQEIESIASSLNISMMEVLRDVKNYPSLLRSANAIESFSRLYESLVEVYNETGSISALAHAVYTMSGYEDMLLSDDAASKIENLKILFSYIEKSEQEEDELTLEDFMTQIFLYSDSDTYDSKENVVFLMTLHGAKGLEFDNVFMPALEEGIFPTERSRYDIEEVEEERRLCYVGITRARKNLYVTYADTRMLFGKTMYNAPSRFLNELPNSNLEYDELGFSSSQRYEYTKPKTPVRTNSYYTPKNQRIYPEEVDEDKDIQQAYVPDAGLNLSKGDVVEHKVFGRGIVISAKHLSSDTLLEIRFDTKGLKKIMAAYAPLKKLN